jgi:predicted nucleotidyltransferase
MPRGAQHKQIGLDTLHSLFGSETRARLVTVFVTRPTGEFYARQLAREIGMSLTPIQRELERLDRLGIVRAEKRGREKYYRVDETHPLFADLKGLVYKTTALGDILRASLGQMEGVDAAFIYGSVAKGGERPTSDLDLFILGKPDQDQLARALRAAEDRLGREINLVTMTAEEWRARSKVREGFIQRLATSPKIFLIGDEQALRRD